MAREERRRRTADPEFGRTLFEKDLSFTPSGMLTRGLIAGLAIVIGLIAVVVGLEEGQPGPAAIGGGVALIAPLAWYFLVYRIRVERFKFFERGLERTTLAGTRRLAYADVASFTYNASRMMVSRMYSHTDVLMELRPADGDPVTYHAQDRDPDDELDGVRAAVSEAVADRLGLLATDQPVEWCDGLRLLAEGLEVATPAGFGKPKLTTVPYDRLERVTFGNGRCRLFEASHDNPVAEKQVLLPNFFPGLVLLGRLTRGRLKVD